MLCATQLEVKKLCFFIQKHLNALVEDIRKAALLEEQDPQFEEDLYSQEFAVEQLLHIALSLDYTDEYGRRQMFNLMKDAIGRPELPEEQDSTAISPTLILGHAPGILFFVRPFLYLRSLASNAWLLAFEKTCQAFISDF